MRKDWRDGERTQADFMWLSTEDAPTAQSGMIVNVSLGREIDDRNGDVRSFIWRGDDWLLINENQAAGRRIDDLETRSTDLETTQAEHTNILDRIDPPDDRP